VSAAIEGQPKTADSMDDRGAWRPNGSASQILNRILEWIIASARLTS